VGIEPVTFDLLGLKIPVLPVSYCEKNFFEYFFHGFGGFLLGDFQ
jgi:hypothetical protein